MSELWPDGGTVALARETPVDLVRSVLQNAPDDTAVLRLDDMGRPDAVFSRHSVFTAERGSPDERQRRRSPARPRRRA